MAPFSIPSLWSPTLAQRDLAHVTSELAVIGSECRRLVTIFVMSSLLLVVIPLGMLAFLVIWLVWQTAYPKKSEAWPVAEATIQSVNTVVVHSGRNSYSVDVGDFSYTVNDEYYSGRLTIAPSFPTEERSPRTLVHQKIQVRYNPDKLEKFLVQQTELEGFILGPYSEPFGEDVDPIDLNIDKV